MAATELEQRVAALEAALLQVKADCSGLLTGQRDAKAQLAQVAAEHAEDIRKVGADVQQKLLDQSAAILKVSQSMVNLQAAVQKWAAAGTLCGAVVFFIIAKVAGL